ADAAIDLDWVVSCERISDAESRGRTNVVQWNVYMGLGYTTSGQLQGESPYTTLETTPRMTVASGQQGAIRLVDATPVAGDSNRARSGVELRIILQPLKSRPVRTVPTEIDRTSYNAG